jgi:homoserine O-acetyltransferase
MSPQYESIGDLPLECGRILWNAQVAYHTIGQLAPTRDNVVLVLHGFTSGPDTILPSADPAEGSWRELVGPGRAIDTHHYFVLCPNALGSTYGSTGPSSIDPQTGKPYGSSFPPLTMRDVVRSQHALLRQLGIGRLVAVVGASFGGLQALQWAVSYPAAMRGIVAASASLGCPPANVESLRVGLAADPCWNGGDYYRNGNLVDTLVRIRVGMLKSYGVDRFLATAVPDPVKREAMLEHRARLWAKDFDANSLVAIMKIMGTHDVTGGLHHIRARVLYVLSRTDPFFPPSLAQDAIARFKAAGVDALYHEIDSENGHSAPTTDASLWQDVIRTFLRKLQG